MKFLVRPELPTASVGSSQATTAAVDNSASLANRLESTKNSGVCCSNNRGHFRINRLSISLRNLGFFGLRSRIQVEGKVSMALPNRMQRGNASTKW